MQISVVQGSSDRRTLTQFIHVTGIRAMHDALAGKVNIVMPLEKK
jgi:hypothetical protein